MQLLSLESYFIGLFHNCVCAKLSSTLFPFEIRLKFCALQGGGVMAVSQAGGAKGLEQDTEEEGCDSLFR